MSRLQGQVVDDDQPTGSSAADKRGPHISVTQVVAGALAALSGSVIASFFGVAGTVVGAAVVSVVATVGAALYSYSFHWVTRQVSPLPGSSERSLKRRPGSDLGLTSEATPDGRGVATIREGLRHLRWRQVALAALAAFVLAMAALTVIELVARGPISSLVPGGGPSGGTSVGDFLGGGGTERSPAKAPTAPEPQTKIGRASCRERV